MSPSSDPSTSTSISSSTRLTFTEPVVPKAVTRPLRNSAAALPTSSGSTSIFSRGSRGSRCWRSSRGARSRRSPRSAFSLRGRCSRGSDDFSAAALRGRRSVLPRGVAGRTRARTRASPRVRPKRPAFGSSTISNSASSSATPNWSSAASLASSSVLPVVSTHSMVSSISVCE